MGRFQEYCACFAEYFPFLEGLTTEYSPEKAVAERKEYTITPGLVVSRKICSHRYLILSGMCAGMWVISAGIYLGVLVSSFISVLLFQRSGHFC